MSASSPLKSMFLRRLLLILAMVGIGVSILTGQLWRLTIAHGATLREEAETKLLTREWIPTTRGKILDRKGRVLAQDRPSFDIAVDFRVIGGEWAQRQAAAVAKYEAGHSHASGSPTAAWSKLDPQLKQERIDQYVPIFQRHADRMWAEMARISGVGDSKLLEKRAEIERHIRAMSVSSFFRGMDRELSARLAAGEEITPELEDDVRKKLDKPLSEQRRPHVILNGVSDPVGFEFQRLIGKTIDLPVTLSDGSVYTVKDLPIMPGLTVIDSGNREYPFEKIDVDVDLSTLPGTLKQDGSKIITCEGVAYHLLGRMKNLAQLDDTNRRKEHLKTDPNFAARVTTPAAMGLPRSIDRGEYTDNDPAGQSGIEASQEDDLRGLRGLRIQRLDTGDDQTIAPTPGHDVHLALDIMLQARVQAAMSKELGLAVAQAWHHADHPENDTVPDGTFLSGAAVVLEVDTGDILAMVSSPTIPRRLLHDDSDEFFKDPLNEKVEVPWLNRAIGRPYPPGSIVKALMLNAAVKLGKHDLDQPIDCTGHLFPNKPDQYRCWIYKTYGRTHGPLFAPDALMRSCNIYFFTVGQRLGPAGIVQAYRMFGVGDGWGLGVGPEFEGTVGTYIHRADGTLERDSEGRIRTTDPSNSDAIQMGIGQGPIAWTPLHAADAYATLARFGIRMKPHLIDSGALPETTDLHLDPRALKQGMEGLWKSVNEHDGTGNHVQFPDGSTVDHFNAPTVQVWGKTGTAEAPSITVKPGDPLYDQGVEVYVEDRGVRKLKFPPGVKALRQGDHSWFVVLVGHSGEDRPKYAISVMMEYAGSGGKVSGPIVNQIIHALIKEGYL